MQAGVPRIVEVLGSRAACVLRLGAGGLAESWGGCARACRHSDPCMQGKPRVSVHVLSFFVNLSDSYCNAVDI